MATSKLRTNANLRSDEDTIYQVDALLGQGGFGTTYTGHRLSRSGRPREKVCIKVCQSRHDWHGEAFFGRLLADNPRAVKLMDAFVATTGSGAAQQHRHVLVFEYMEHGTVWNAIDAGTTPWTEARARREIKAILELLATLHQAGVTHRDLKPDNVYLRDGKLTLGDFGITKMNLDPKNSLVSAFAPAFAPNHVEFDRPWAAADDVFQVGLLAATLLSGTVWMANTVSAKSIAALPISDELKCWIWHATGAQYKRYWDAAEALDALTSLKHISLAAGHAPRSLSEHHVTFTGRIDGMPATDAKARARQHGARPQAALSDKTSLVVVGTMRAGGIGAAENLTLFALRERLRQGQQIRIISGRQFKRLVHA